MEINRVNTPKVVGTELKKQSAKVKNTGLKDDKFEKSLTPDVVMDTLSNFKCAFCTNFTFESVHMHSPTGQPAAVPHRDL